MHGAIEKEKARFLVRARIRLFLTSNKRRYVDRLCIRYIRKTSLLPHYQDGKI